MKKRIEYLDWLRVIACLMVMLVHACEYYYCSHDHFIVSETNRWLVSFIDSFCRISVPLFFLISGYLLTPMAEDADYKSFIWKRFKRVMIPYFVFVVILCTLPLAWGGTHPKMAVRGLTHIFLNFPMQWGHMWFPYVLFGLYLFLPVISAWPRTASKKAEEWFLFAWFIASCMPYISHYLGSLWGDCGWNRFNMLYCFNGYLGYFVLGHYLKTHFNWCRKARLWGGLAFYIAGSIFTALTFFQQVTVGEPLPRSIEIGWDFVCPNILGATFGFFIFIEALFMKRPEDAAPKKVDILVGDISKRSYGMYLMHMLYLNMFFNVFNPVMPTALAIPVIAVCAFICSYITSKAISLIPGGKYIVG